MLNLRQASRECAALCGTLVGLFCIASTYAADAKPLATPPSQDLLLWLMEMDIQTKEDTEAINAVMSKTKDAEQPMPSPVNKHPRLISRKNGDSHE